MIAEKIQKALREERGTPEKVKILSGYFKCGKGEYGEGDRFLGVTVPEQRKIAKAFFREATAQDVAVLLKSPWHEDRLTGLFLWVYRFERADDVERKKIYRLYLKHWRSVNNWDLVDSTTPNIIGEYVWAHPEERKRLFVLAKSRNIWKRRMAILATFSFLRRGRFDETLLIARTFLPDSCDLIHKATGWMLREVGKRDESVLKSFLDAYASRMPRTMLRYAIEKFSKEDREKYRQR